jgi:hypothetical protein
MIIGNPQRTILNTYATRRILTLLVLGAVSLAASAQHTSATPPAHPTATAPKPASDPEQAEKPGPNDAGNQGIRVHGHWVLQVKNADGTLGERREFNNSLVTAGGGNFGSQLMVGILSGDVAISPYPAIALITGSAPADPSIACPSSACWYFGTSNSQWGSFPNYETGLTTSVTFSPTTALVFSGNWTSPGSASISTVQLLYTACENVNKFPQNINSASANAFSTGTYGFGLASATPSSCSSSNAGGGFDILGPLTSTIITNSSGAAAPLGVTSGQVVTVTVTLSFS